MLAAIAARIRLFGPLEEALQAARGSGAGRVVALGAISSLTINILGTGVAFVLQAILTKSLGDSTYGIYVLALGWMNVALIVARLDLDVVSTRFVGAYRVRAEWALLRGLVHRARQLVFFISTGVSTLAAVLLLVLRAKLEPGVFGAALVACGLLPLSGLLALTGATLQGLKDVLGAQIPGTLLRPLLFMSIVLVTRALVPGALTAPVALTMNLAATAGALAVSWYLVHRRLPSEMRSSAPAYSTPEWVRVGAWFVLIDLFQITISQQSDVLVVGAFIDPARAGYYSVASQLAALIQFGVTAVMFIATPFISELFAQQRLNALQRLTSSTVAVAFLLAAPVFIGLLVFGRWALGLFGTDRTFVAAYPALVVLAMNQLVSACIGQLAGTMMSMTGRQREAATLIGTSAAFNLALSLLLTPRFGLVGAAAATFAATLLRSAMLAIHIHRHLGISLLSVRRSS